MNRQQKKIIQIVVAAAILVVMLIQSRSKPDEPIAAPIPSATATVFVPPPKEVQNAVFARKKIPKDVKFDAPGKLADYLEVRKDVEKQRLPKEGVASSLEDLKGKVSLDSIEKGEVIHLSRFALPEEIGGVSYHILPGTRAVALRFDRIRAVSGFVTQGDLVDIFGSFANQSGQSLTRLVMSKAKILAVNNIFVASQQPSTAASPAPAASPAAGAGGPRGQVVSQDITMVTFELTPIDAERLILASEQMRLYLVLRSPADPEVTRVDPVDDVDVYSERPKKDPVPKYDVDILKGNGRKAQGVRIESEQGSDLATEVKKSTYFQQEEEVIRDFSSKDFVIQSK